MKRNLSARVAEVLRAQDAQDSATGDLVARILALATEHPAPALTDADWTRAKVRACFAGHSEGHA